MPEATLLVDEAGRLAGVNGDAEALLGPGAMLAAARKEPVASLLPWLAEAVQHVLGGADEVGLEAEVSTPEGNRSVSARLRRVLATDVTLRGVVVVLEDLTERRAVEAQQRSTERLTALGRLAADLAHEVNNPLACVVSGLSFVEAEHARVAAALAPAELEEAKLALEEARQAALRVGRIVSSLQSLGRPSAPLLREVDLARVLRAAMHLVRPEVLVRARLDVEIAKTARVRASESLLVELFHGLILGVAQAVEPGRPESSALALKLDVEGTEACVSIAIRREAGEVAPNASQHEASCLGTAVTHGIVAALGGSLREEAGAGVGVELRLPLGND